jgi:hypothetical protein
MILSKQTTGTWYDPSQPGHGLIIHADKVLLVYWFTYLFDGGQAWYVAQGDEDFRKGELEMSLYAPEGRFPAIDSQNGDPCGVVTLKAIGANKLGFDYQFLNDHQGCKAVDFSPRNPKCGGSFEFARLT